MTFIDASETFDRPDLFPILRSEWIDAYTRFEVAIRRLRGRLLGATGNKCLSACIEDLNTVEKSCLISADQIKRLRKLLLEASTLGQIRASLVHGTMTKGEISGETAALFHNAADQAQGLPIFLVMTMADLKGTCRQLNRMVQTLEALLNPRAQAPAAD